MALQAAALGVLVAVEAAEVLRAAGDVALGGGPQYLRDGAPIGAVAQAGLQAARYACRRYGSDPNSYPSDTAANYEKACRPYLDDIGEGAGPTLELPFRGGQCCGVTYQFTYTFRNPNTGQLQDSVQEFSNVQIVGLFERSNQPAQPTKTGGVRLRDCSNGTIQEVPLGTTFEGANLDQSISNISIVGGAPDNCGNPEPEFDEPEGPGIVIGPVVPIVIAPTFDVDASVNVNLDGTIEFNFGLGPINVDPFGDGGDGGPGEGGGGPEPPGAPTIGPVTPGGNGGFGGDDELGEPPVGQRWVGIAMSITARPDEFGVIPTATVDKVYPTVVGNARLIYDAFGFTVVGTPVQIRSDRVTLWEEVRGANPVALRVNLQAGFGYSYFGIAQPEEN